MVTRDTSQYNGVIATPSVVVKVIEEILGVTPRLEPRFDRLTISADERVQSRIDKNNAPTAMVNRYAFQMSHFTFPPMVVTEDAVIVDGNTRNKARAKRNERWVEALVVPVAWETADEDTKRRLLLISETINNMNGLPLNAEERKKMSITMIEDGKSDDEILGQVGTSINEIRELRDHLKATTRLQSLGYADSDLDFSDRTLRAFGKPRVLNLDDESYRGVVELTRDAGLKANEVKALASTLNEVASGDSRRERLARERQARESDITAMASGQAAIGVLARGLARQLKALLEQPVQAYIERNPELADEYVTLLRQAAPKLVEIADAHVIRPAASATTANVSASLQ